MKRTAALLLAALVSGCGAGTSLPPPIERVTPSPSGLATVSTADVPTSLPGTLPSVTTLPSATTPSTSGIPVEPGEPWMVYQLYDGSFSIKLVRPDGTGDHVLVSNASGDPLHPDWSPNATLIAYVVDNDIWIIGVDGSTARKVFDCKDPCVVGDSPAWSPDGSEIAFTTADGVGGQAPTNAIEAVNISTGAVRTLVTSTGPDYAFNPRWAPDGRQIVVSIERFATTAVTDCTPLGSAVAVVDLAVQEAKPRLLTDMSTFADYPDWSPDGTKIVFTTIDLGTRDARCAKFPLRSSDLYVIKPDGKGLKQLTYNPSGQTPMRSVRGVATASGPLSSQPTWAPDGASIIFVQVDGSVWPGWTMARIDADGTGLRPATGTTFMKGTHPRLRPTG